MPRRSPCLLALALALAIHAGCEQDSGHGFDLEWRGDAIDIVGVGTSPDQTCAGTFEYLDRYAAATAAEFGASGHLGTYRWYSQDEFVQRSPCSADVLGCAGANGVFTPVMPLEHEVVHLANSKVSACPSVLSEGLAEYYGTSSSTPTDRDVLRLIEDSEHGRISGSDYPLAGAFASFLVERFGLGSVLQLCDVAGPYPSPAEFAAACDVAFGALLEELLEQFEGFACSYEQYRAKHFDCSGTPVFEVGDVAVETVMRVDCADSNTLGARAGRIWTSAKFEVVEDGIYPVSADVGPLGEGVQVELIECAACANAPRIHSLSPNATPPDPLQLKQGGYAVRVSAPEDFSGDVRLSIGVAF